MKRVIVAITGASGAIFGVRLLQILHDIPEVETHFAITAAGRLTLASECDLSPKALAGLATATYHPSDVGAALSSGSFRVHGMIIAPCSIKTMSNIATGSTGDLISRAADVVLKERRRLVLAVRETPLHAGHLDSLLRLARLGAIIFPPVPAFYHRPASIQEIVDQTCMRLLDQIDIEVSTAPRWGEDIGIVRNGPQEGRDPTSPQASRGCKAGGRQSG